MSASAEWPTAGGPAETSAHYDRVRAVLHVAQIESDRRHAWGEPGLTVADLTSRLTRIQAGLHRLRPPGSAVRGDESDDSAEAWMLAAYDVTLAELCRAYDLPHALDDDTVFPDAERLRVELELLTSLLPFE